MKRFQSLVSLSLVKHGIHTPMYWQVVFGEIPLTSSEIVLYRLSIQKQSWTKIKANKVSVYFITPSTDGKLCRLDTDKTCSLCLGA